MVMKKSTDTPSKDFKTGNKRFSGIMKATHKQFDNDMKKLRKESSDIELDGEV